jgi:hypothetical protein
MAETGTFHPAEARARLIKRGLRQEFIIPYAYRPFDMQWVYWEPDTNLLDRKREELFSAVQGGSLFLTSRQKCERTREGSLFFVTAALADYHLTRPGSTCFPVFSPPAVGQAKLEFGGASPTINGRRPNLSDKALQYLAGLGIDPLADKAARDILWMHILAVGHAPAYLTENASILWQDWPRIPLPATREALEASAALGRQIAALLDVTQPVKGVTSGTIRPELKAIGLITHVEGRQINDQADLAVTAGWANPGHGGITMPATGKAVRRDFTADESRSMGVSPMGVAGVSPACPPAGMGVSPAVSQPGAAGPHPLGEAAYDIYLNDAVYWKNVPQAVWEYTLGGYQVMKKWLSYREHKILGRPLKTDEARYVTEMSRRIAAILLLQPALDQNYRRIKDAAFAWAPLNSRNPIVEATGA